LVLLNSFCCLFGTAQKSTKTIQGATVHARITKGFWSGL
jgi:hypothetical protein